MTKTIKIPAQNRRNLNKYIEDQRTKLGCVAEKCKDPRRHVKLLTRDACAVNNLSTPTANANTTPPVLTACAETMTEARLGSTSVVWRSGSVEWRMDGSDSGGYGWGQHMLEGGKKDNKRDEEKKESGY
ncbi:hypothetical protein B0H14DRAFT_2562656 [Mycena olivaceomarginata]|nr:hypothetical protein B0H14DRAFT_2562656 [Mycena olivaceomarginata]